VNEKCADVQMKKRTWKDLEMDVKMTWEVKKDVE
jgi:hypothetical protein